MTTAARAPTAYTCIALWGERPRLSGYELPEVPTYVRLGETLLMM
ncbi:hypothetical protein [Streptomyces sp. NPDC051776]